MQVHVAIEVRAGQPQAAARLDRRRTEVIGDQQDTMVLRVSRERGHHRRGGLRRDLCGELVSLAARRDHQGSARVAPSRTLDAHVHVMLSEAVGDGIQPATCVQIYVLFRIFEHTLSMNASSAENKAPSAPTRLAEVLIRHAGAIKATLFTLLAPCLAAGTACLAT